MTPTDWLVREHTPAWLDVAGLPELAERLRTLPPEADTVFALEGVKRDVCAVLDPELSDATARVPERTEFTSPGDEALYYVLRNAFAAGGGGAVDASLIARKAAVKRSAGDYRESAPARLAVEVAELAAGLVALRACVGEAHRAGLASATDAAMSVATDGQPAEWLTGKDAWEALWARAPRWALMAAFEAAYDAAQDAAYDAALPLAESALAATAAALTGFGSSGGVSTTDEPSLSSTYTGNVAHSSRQSLT